MSTHPSVIEVGEKELPLHCPLGDTNAWNLHPRVFLDIAHTGSAKCPYCGQEYHLKPGTKVGH